MTTPSLTNPNPKREGRDWHREGSTIFTLKPNDSPRRGPRAPEMINDNWFLVQGPNAHAVAVEVHAALNAASARPSPGDPVRADFQQRYAARIHERLTNTGWTSLLPGGDAYSQGTQFYWLNLAGIASQEFKALRSDTALSVSTPTGEGEEQCPQPHRYDRGECCGGDCASRSEKRWDRRLIAEAICDGYSNGNEQFSDASAAIQHGCLMAADAVMELSRPIAEKQSALAHPQQGGERDGYIKRIAELEAALKPFAEIGGHMGRTPIQRAVSVGYLGVEADGINSHARSTATVADFRAARDVLQRSAAPTLPSKSSGEEASPCHWGGGNDTIWCSTCGAEYAYAKGEQRPACPRHSGEEA